MFKRINSIFPTVFVGLATVLGATTASAAVPASSSVEGALFSSGGGAAADGNYNITFSLFKDELGGNPLWSEGPVLIGVKSGQWQHLLGSKVPLSAGVLNGATLWLGLQIASDPELPRKPLASSAFAIRAAVAEGLECSGCVGAAQIDGKFLAGYAKAADLNKVAFSGLFSDLTGGPDLSAYTKTSALAKVATGGNYTDLNGIPDLTLYAKAADLQNYVKAASLATVAGTGSYNDLKDKPVLSKKGDKCGSGLVMVGIKADGSYECTASAIAPDMIDEVSNNLIYNQFVDSKAGTVDNPIPDGSGAGKSDSLDFPDIGSAQAIWVNVALSNSDVSKVKIELYGPNMATPYLLYSGEKAGTGFSVGFNKDTPLSTGGGDMNKDWVGKNIKGTWSITVKDPIKNQSGANDGKFSWDVTIQTLSSKKIQVKGNLIVDGDLTVNGVNTTQTGNTLPATFRLAKFQTYHHSLSWLMENNASMYGGINPSNWTDGAWVASQVSADKEVLRTIYTEKRYAGKNANVCSEVYIMYSSTTALVCSALFRVTNTTANAITWTPFFYYSAYSGWGEQASIAVNGANVWSTGGQGKTSVNLTIPANRISTVIFVTTSATQIDMPAGWNGHERATVLGFYNDSLALPAGLKFVDDFDTAKGGWEQ